MRKLVLALLPLAACIPVLPPVNPGFVSTTPRSPGDLDASVQLGGAGVCAVGCIGVGGGTLHLEPYFSDVDSVPIEASVSNSYGVWFVPTRLGLRHRVGHGISIGTGLGPNFMLYPESPAYVGGAADFEFAAGHEGKVGSISFAARPGAGFTSVDGTTTPLAALPMELSAVAFLGDVGLGGSVFGGPGYSQGTVFGAFGATVTVVGRSRATTR